MTPGAPSPSGTPSGTDPLTGAPLPRAVLAALAARAAGDPSPEETAPAQEEAPVETVRAPSPSPDAPAPPSAPPSLPGALPLTAPGVAVVLFASPSDMRVEGTRARWSVMLAQALALQSLGLARVHEGPVALAVALPAALAGDPAAWTAAVEERMNVWRPTDRVEALASAERTAALLRADPRTPLGTGPAGWRCLLHIAQRMKCPADILGVERS